MTKCWGHIGVIVALGLAAAPAADAATARSSVLSLGGTASKPLIAIGETSATNSGSGGATAQRSLLVLNGKSVVDGPSTEVQQTVTGTAILACAATSSPICLIPQVGPGNTLGNGQYGGCDASAFQGLAGLTVVLPDHSQTTAGLGVTDAHVACGTTLPQGAFATASLATVTRTGGNASQTRLVTSQDCNGTFMTSNTCPGADPVAVPGVSTSSVSP